jgi:hypothetical protein
MTKPVHSVQPSRFGPARKGRLKPCLFCKVDFYCPQCQDTGGSLPEKKYCSNKCANTDRYHNGKEVDRFWEKVDRSAGQEACWPWTGAITSQHGYGCVQWQGRVLGAHKVAWVLTNGPVPKGLCVLHKCDNRPCCNPAHHFLGTKKDNSKDAFSKDRAWSKLKADDVRAIRLSSLPSKELADQYGVGYSAIWAVRTGRKWSHVK